MSIADIPLHDRLQSWRRRQSLQWPGLFKLSLLHQRRTSVPTTTPSPTTSIKLYAHRDKTIQIHLNDCPIVICDGCGALLHLPLPLSSSLQHEAAVAALPLLASCSSASTQSPPPLPPPPLPPQKKSHQPDIHSISCSQCNFHTVLNSLRHIFQLPGNDHCGPRFPPSIAFAILVEAITARLAIKQLVQNEYVSWFLDPQCRTIGLHALCSALGMHDEQMEQQHFFADSSNLSATPFDGYALEAEQFLNLNLQPDHPAIPSIPLSVSLLIKASSIPTKNSSLQQQQVTFDKRKQKLSFAQNSFALVEDVKRICTSNASTYSKDMCTMTSALAKIGKCYADERVKARYFNHILCPLPHIPLSFDPTVKTTQNNVSKTG